MSDASPRADTDVDPDANDRISVSFEITSESLTAEQITSILQIDPDRAWNLGDPMSHQSMMPFAIRRFRFSRWSLFSQLGSGDTLRDHLDDLYDRAAPALERAADLPAETYRGLSIVRYLDGRAFQSHGGGISPEWVALLGRVGGDVDLDQYVLRDGPDDDDWPQPSDSIRRRSG